MATVKKVKKVITPAKKEILYQSFGVDSEDVKSSSLNVLLQLIDIEDYIDSEINPEDSFSIKKDNKDFIFFNLILLPLCCGVIEIGNLRYNPRNKPTEKELLEVLEAFPKHKDKKTFIINTNGQGSCIFYEQVLAKSKMFTLVKEFQNTTGNNIKMWVSNNG